MGNSVDLTAIASELRGILEKYLPALELIPGDKFTYKPSPGKWSKKEILGHLIDSALSNIRRFIIAQYEERPKIVYDQDKWVAFTNYQAYNQDHLVRLWYLLNQHICHILDHVKPDMSQREAETEEIHTIHWLASDYIKHLRHHLHQVLDLEPIPYPT